MNIYDTRRKWYKNLSLLLVMTLMIGLMSGCGQKNSNNKPADSIDVAAQTKTVHSKSDAIVTKDEELASSMDALEDIISNGETAKANEIVQDIVDIIDTENNDIAEWLEAQNKVSESLSEEAKATYNERLATFEASIKEKQDKTSSIIASLTDAINNNEVDNIEAYYNEENNCFGCIVNCGSTSIKKIMKKGFSLEEAQSLDSISNHYGMDSCMFASIADKEEDFEKLAEDIVLNNKSYELKPSKKSKIHDESNEFEELGFCRFLIKKNILDQEDIKMLKKSILGE